MKYEIMDEYTYNINKKRFLMGIAESPKVIISKYEKQAFVTQFCNQEWVSMMEFIFGSGRLLPF